jgi:sugar/nucleoside kinase (ribokinase family)
MTCVDPASEAGRVDWFQWLENVLPTVDLFLPSIDEILFMANRPKYDELAEKFPGDIMQGIDAKLVEQTAQTLLELGVSVAVIKMGKEGLYLRTGTAVPGKGAGWSNASLFMPCLEADTVGTTGAGDCTIAGFLAGFVKGGTPEQVAESASGIGGLSTEAADATSAIPHWDAVQQKISKGWKRLDSKFY